MLRSEGSPDNVLETDSPPWPSRGTARRSIVCISGSRSRMRRNVRSLCTTKSYIVSA